MQNFKYFLIEKSKGRNGYRGMWEPVDGLMGLSRPQAPIAHQWYKTGPIFYQSYAAAASGRQQVFSFYIGDNVFTKQSFVDFNGYLLYNVQG